MNEHLVGYLLNNLDEGTRRQVETHLDKDPEARRQLNLLRQALEPLECDRVEVAPPADLVVRTLGRVAEHICNDELPRAPAPGPALILTARSWWRRIDVLVAACLLITALGMGLPVLYQLQSRGSQAVMLSCQNNLREFYVALATYHDQHGQYPDLKKEAPRNVAGLVVPVLADAGVLSPMFSIRCAGIGPHLGCQVGMQDLRTMPADEFEAKAPELALCYAYTLGYRNEAGDYYPAWHNQAASSLIPILADRPPAEGAPGNSINHGGAGQNVLFLDGNVRFVTARTIQPDDDIFLNHNRRVAAGVGPHDVVLGSSAARP